MCSNCALFTFCLVHCDNEEFVPNPYSFASEETLLALPQEVKIVVANQHRETCVREVDAVLVCCLMHACLELSCGVCVDCSCML